MIEQGEVFDRDYAQRQRFPGDAEAVEGMGRITVHANEHLAPSDKGLAMMRRRLREQIRTVAAGGRPMHATDNRPMPVPTYGGDSVLNIPQQREDEATFFSELAHEFMAMQYAVDDLPEPERMARVTTALKDVETRRSAE